ncbi:hypothetical protein [Fulvimonas yonginensis]|uniref:Uncharacterized protein n=1 Tax=Fulvimonas yonginensis TaxID=1495200 RepID=A0ABU8JFM7_9GAMM
MSTNRIRPGTSAIEILRALATGKTGTAGTRPPAATDSGGPATTTHDPAVLRQRLKDVVQGVDLDSKEGLRTAQRPVLREILLWEFGATFREHAEFTAMLDSIERTLDADPEAPRKLVALLRDLQK